jgi:glycosyltransferase involved in cell wall biosynthesis
MKLLICTQAVDKNHPILGFFHGWILEFAKHFDEVHVICLQKGVYDLPAHVHVYSLGKEEGESRVKYLYRFYKNFGRIFLSVRVDYIFFHMGAIYNILAAPFFIVRKLFGTTFYWWKAHGHINTFGKLALAFVDRVYTSTESGFSVDTPKRHIVGQAIDTDTYILPPPNTVRGKEIIYVGRISPVKRIEDFIDTAAILHAQDSELVFTIIGPLEETEYVAKMQERCKILGLQDYVSFVGQKSQSELVQIRHKALIFLNTSVTHSMDKTVLSSALCGCIPVTSNRAFIDLLQPDGLYIENASPQDYADCITALIPRINFALQKKLRDDIVRSHSLNTFSQRIFAV